MGRIIFSICLLLWISSVIAYPLNSHYLPKEYYQRQNLPDIPGYIPVYIKHDDEPLPKWKESNPEEEIKQVNHSLNEESKPEEKSASPVHQHQQQRANETKTRTNKFKENPKSSANKQNK